MIWSETNTALLRQYWAEGLTCSQIAERLGRVSRNSVIGKAHRLNLSSRKKTPVIRIERKPRKPKTPLLIGAARVEAFKAAVEAEHLPAGLALFDLRADSCRWPIGDPRSASFRFCGCEKQEGSSYCAGHHQLAHRPRAEWEAEQAAAIEKATAPANAMEAA